ncbi:MAG TPA: hypothetical protein VJB34_00775 [Bdellovibrionota bacterium]|nr:hypothetical protein [Bdellovibrionota bacterium]
MKNFKYILSTACIFYLLGVACTKKTEKHELPPEKTLHVQLEERQPPARHNQCHLCHLKKFKFFIPKVKSERREHQDISLKHGSLEISCNNCHDVNNSNYLRTESKTQTSFENSSPVCRRCHIEQYSDWLEGLHGRRTGGWNRNKVQSHCIDCHDPHSVTFKKMKAKPAPKKVKKF